MDNLNPVFLHLNPVFLPPFTTARWQEAVERKTCVRTWKACWEIAEIEAGIIEKHDPDNVLVAALLGIAVEAQARYLALMPRRV